MAKFYGSVNGTPFTAVLEGGGSKMSTDLGLSDSHESEVVHYLRFARSKRGEALKAVADAFGGVVESRLLEDTYTLEEVKELLGNIEDVIRADIETELIYSSHTNVLLLKQVFEQAEKWHLNLQTNMSELENRELIEHVAKFEAVKFSDDMKSTSLTGMRKLEPLNEGKGGAALLQMEIDRLKEEKRRLADRLHQAESTVKTVLEQKKQLQADVKEAQQRHQQEKEGRDGRASEPTDVQLLRDQLAAMTAKLEGAADPTREALSGEVQEELGRNSRELLRVTAELEKTKEELERKFNQTTQYNNLKTMLTSKNELIKQLRDKLRKYEPEAD